MAKYEDTHETKQPSMEKMDKDEMMSTILYNLKDFADRIAKLIHDLKKGGDRPMNAGEKELIRMALSQGLQESFTEIRFSFLIGDIRALEHATDAIYRQFEAIQTTL